MQSTRLLFWIGAAIVLIGTGCDRRASDAVETRATNDASAAAMSAPERDSRVLRVHWLGKRRVMEQTNATKLKEIWNLPESARLEEQTLGKLSAAPWALFGITPARSQTNRLRPILDDLLQEECYAEVRRAAGRPVEMVLAVRLNDERAQLWRTNLAVLLESMTTIRPQPAADGGGWSLRKSDPPNLIELRRSGDWTLIGIGHQTNSLLGEVRSRIDDDPDSFPIRGADYLLAGEMDPQGLASAFSIRPSAPGNLLKVTWVAAGYEEEVRLQGELRFQQPLPAPEQWNIPFELVRGNLAEFTAIRGLRPWLASSRWWQARQLGTPPDQLFVWAMQDLPAQTFFAAPSGEAPDQVRRLTAETLARQESWFGTSGYALFAQSGTGGLVWRGLPYSTPYLEAIALTNGMFMAGGFFPNGGETVLPPDAVRSTLERTNLLGYGWEMTGLRLEQWLYIQQFARMMFQRSQLPSDSAAVTWIKALVSRMPDTVSTVAMDNPHQVSFFRRSALGLSAPELHLLAEWLESPKFPRGLHTLEAPRDTRLADEWFNTPAGP